MAERVYQLRFDDNFKMVPAVEVAPAFAGWPEIAQPDQLYTPEPGGRFVRELPSDEQIDIIQPETAAHYFVDHVFSPFSEFEQEELWALMLNTKNRLTHTAMIYRGSINMVTIRTAEIFRAAVRVNATAIIIGHNHPSGAAQPSPEDAKVTHAINEAGQILGIELLDHLVIGHHDSWISLKQRGLGFDL